MFRILLRICTTLAIVWLSSRIAALALPISPGDIGTRDGIQYWNSLQLLLSGENPYNPQAVLDLEATIGGYKNQPTMSRNPPWVAVFLSPIFWGSFSQAMWAWRLAQLILVVAIWRLLVPSHASREQKIVSGISLAAFYPLLDSFHSGQLGILLALGVTLIIRQRQLSFSLISTTALVICLSKPHLFLPLFGYLVFDKSKILITAACVCVAASLASFGLEPLLFWIESIRAPLHPELITRVVEFRSDSLCSWTRGVLSDWGFGESSWLMLVFACASLLSGYVVKKRSKDFECDAPTLVLFGLLLTPYGWMSDYTILAPLIIGPKAHLELATQRLKVIALCVTSAGGAAVFGSAAHACAWVLVPLCRHLRIA